MAPGTWRTWPAQPNERNASRLRLTHRPVPGPGKIFSTDVRDCSPVRYTISVTSPASGGPGRRATTVTAAVRFRQDPARSRLTRLAPNGPAGCWRDERRAPTDGRPRADAGPGHALVPAGCC